MVRPVTSQHKLILTESLGTLILQIFMVNLIVIMVFIIMKLLLIMEAQVIFQASVSLA